MAKTTAWGLIETRGLTGLVEACDAMAKTAYVSIGTARSVEAGLISVVIKGEVGAVQVALDAGAAGAQRVGELHSAHVIPRPEQRLESLLD